MTIPSRFRYGQAAEMKAFYAENGYAIISNGIPYQEIVEFKTELRNLLNAFMIKASLPELEIESDAIFTEGLMALENRDHEYVATLYDTIYQSPAFFRLVGNRDIETTVRLLMGVGTTHPLYGYTNRCLFAPPSDNRRTYGWHQEVFYTIPNASYMQTWAPLVADTTIKNGTIEVLPGSHKEGIARQSWNDIPGRATQIIIADEIIAKYQPTPIEMKLGELMIFSGLLAHRSGNNSSNEVRYSLVGMYHDVRHTPFKAPKLAFNYRGQSPREYYDSIQSIVA